MKWIKASELLPNKSGKYWIKYINHNGEIRTGSFFDGFKFPHHKSEVEWLDETPTTTVAPPVAGDKDLIIHGLEEGCEQWKAEYDNCRAILQFLVELKRVKDTEGKTEYYEKNQPLAWEGAKRFLEKYQHL